MGQTINDFRNDQRDELADTGTIPLVTNTQLDRFRKRAVRRLYGWKISNEVTNYTGVQTSMPLAVDTTLDYAIPSGWLRVTDVQFWKNETNTKYLATSSLWSDRERPSFVRIYDGPDFVDDRIMLLGLKAWTDVSDTDMTDIVVEVVLKASIYMALTNLANRRMAARRFAGASKASDATLANLTFWRRHYKQDLEEAKKAARKAINVKF